MESTQGVTLCNVHSATPQVEVEPIVGRNEHCLTIDIRDEILFGSRIIVPRQHRTSPFDLTKEEITATFELLRAAKGEIGSSISPDGYNLGWNCGSIAAQEVVHAHLQCIPDGSCLLLGLGLIKDVGEESAGAMVEERERNGPYTAPVDLVRRTGLKPQAVLSLAMSGAFDGLNPNRREALWEAGLSARPTRSGQRAFPVSVEDGMPDLADFTAFERMTGEYRVMGIYPRGHLMEFVRPRLSRDVLPAYAVESMDEGREVLVAGWPVARQHPRGKDGTVFVTIEDETRSLSNNSFLETKPATQ